MRTKSVQYFWRLGQSIAFRVARSPKIVKEFSSHFRQYQSIQGKTFVFYIRISINMQHIEFRVQKYSRFYLVRKFSYKTTGVRVTAWYRDTTYFMQAYNSILDLNFVTIKTKNKNILSLNCFISTYV